MTDHRPGLLFVVNSLGIGGAEKQVVTLLNRLDTQRFRLHLAYLKHGEALLPQLDTSRLDELLCCDAQRRVDRAALARLRELAARRNIDAIICTNAYAMLYGWLARAALPSRPALVTVFHTTLLKGYKEKLQMLVYSSLFKRCDLLIYVCENQRRYWQGQGLRHATDAVVHNGIDVEHFNDRREAGESQEVRATFGFGAADYVVGLCSALRPEKAHSDLLQVLARMRAQGIPVKALFIGDGPERSRIEAGIDALGLGGEVRITGLQQDVRPLIACCDVMALVSHSVETFSLAALESMSMGKALVMSDIGGASEQVLHGLNGFLFEPGDLDSLQRHLTSLRSQALRDQMGTCGAQRVRRLFTVDSMTSGFENRLDELLAREKSSSHDWNMSTLHK